MSALRQTALRTRNTTYGEVVPESIWKHVLPAMKLTAADVFCDVGSGTGKIPLQVALQTPCRRSVGVEFVKSRHDIGVAALDRLRALAAADSRILTDATTAAAVTAAVDRVDLIQGDACDPGVPLDDVTAIFINNTVFQPDLMARILDRIASLPKLRVVRARAHACCSQRVLRWLTVDVHAAIHCAACARFSIVWLQLVTLRRICARHRDTTCARKASPCCAFAHPQEASGEVWPTWDRATTMFVYKRAARITDYFPAEKRRHAAVKKPEAEGPASEAAAVGARKETVGTTVGSAVKPSRGKARAPPKAAVAGL